MLNLANTSTEINTPYFIAAPKRTIHNFMKSFPVL